MKKRHTMVFINLALLSLLIKNKASNKFFTFLKPNCQSDKISYWTLVELEVLLNTTSPGQPQKQHLYISQQLLKPDCR